MNAHIKKWRFFAGKKGEFFCCWCTKIAKFSYFFGTSNVCFGNHPFKYVSGKNQENKFEELWIILKLWSKNGVLNALK